MLHAAQEIVAFEATLEQRRRAVEAALEQLAPAGPAPAVVAAVRDSLLAPAKRLRPILSLTFESFAGVEGARTLARDLTLAGQAALVPFGPRGKTLHELAGYVVMRRC